MSPFTSRLAGAVALAWFGWGFASLAWGDDDDAQHRQRIEQRRQAAAQRYEDWLREQEKRHQQWRDAQTNDGDPVLELPNSGLPPGQYTLRLPFGLNVRIQAPPGAPPFDRGRWDPRSFADIRYQARLLGRHLQELEGDLRRSGMTERANEATELRQRASQLADAAGQQRPVEEIRGQFAEFDRLWHPFAYQLTSRQDTPPFIAQKTSAIDEMEDTLHQMLSISPAPPYDRPLVAALTHELEQATRHLLGDIQSEPAGSLEWNSLVRRADRVRRQAADLNAAVQQNASFATIVEEYVDFDRSWHRFLELARSTPEMDRHLREMTRRVRRIDLELHQELYVNVPIAGHSQQILHLSATIASTADHLREDLEYEIRNDRRDVLTQAQAFAFAANNLHRTLQERRNPGAQHEALDEMLASWRQLLPQIEGLRRDRFEHSQEMAARLNADIQRLSRLWSEQTAGR